MSTPVIGREGLLRLVGWAGKLRARDRAGGGLADADGVYDPNWYNDRLLLGLKGTMSEGRAASDQAADGRGPAG